MQDIKYILKVTVFLTIRLFSRKYFVLTHSQKKVHWRLAMFIVYLHAIINCKNRKQNNRKNVASCNITFVFILACPRIYILLLRRTDKQHTIIIIVNAYFSQPQHLCEQQQTVFHRTD